MIAKRAKLYIIMLGCCWLVGCGGTTVDSIAEIDTNTEGTATEGSNNQDDPNVSDTNNNGSGEASPNNENVGMGASQCESHVAAGEIAYAKCEGCHGVVQANGISEGGAFDLPIDPLKAQFDGFDLPLHDYIYAEMADKVVNCGQDCSNDIAAYLLHSAGKPWCPERIEEPIGSTLAPIAYERLPGTNIDAPQTTCSAIAPRPVTFLTRDQIHNAINDIFEPIAINNLAQVLADIPEKDANSSLDALTLGRYLDVFELIGFQVANNFEGLGLNCSDSRQCMDRFISEYASLAWGRSITSEEKQALLSGVYDPHSAEFAVGVSQVVSALLLSGEFLYQAEQGVDANDGRVVLTGFDKAKKLSWLLWDSVPDSVLINAAQNGQLDSQSGFEFQVERMLADTKAKRGFANFHKEWLHLTGDITPVVESGLQELSMIAKSAFEKRESLDQLFLTPRAYVNSTLKRVYGLVDTSSPVAPAGDQCDTTAQCRDIFGASATDCKDSKSSSSVCYCGDTPCGGNSELLGDVTQFDEMVLNDRPGILTRAALLAGTSEGSSSPSRRGELISNSILCVEVKEPPLSVQDSFSTLPDLNGRSFRELMEELVAEPSCMVCHESIDPFGFALEHFGPDGEWRDTQENGAPIDAYVAHSPLGVAFDGAIDMTEAIAKSESTAACYAGHWYKHAFPKNEVVANATNDDCAMEELKTRFIESGGDLVSLIRFIVHNPAFHYREL